MDSHDPIDDIIARLPLGYTQEALAIRKRKGNVTAQMDPETDAVIAGLPNDYTQQARTSSTKRRKVEVETDLPVGGKDIGQSSTDQTQQSTQQAVTDTEEDGSKPKRVRGVATCPTCGVEVPKDHMARHKRRHEDLCFDCPFCTFSGTKNLTYMRTHYRKFHLDQNHKCAKCSSQFTSEKAFFAEEHLARCIRCTPRENPPLEPLPENERPLFFHDPISSPSKQDPFWADPAIQPYVDDDEVTAIISHYWQYFRQRFITNSNLVHEYFYRTTGTDTFQFTMPNALRHVYTNVNCSMNFNIGLTTLLKKDNRDGTYSYRIFLAQNHRKNIFERNLLVHDLATLEAAIKKIDELGDIFDFVERLGTDEKVVALLGVAFYCYLRPEFIGGAGGGRLPSWITYNKKSVMSLDRSPNKNLYTDNLCLFRSYVAWKKDDPHDLHQVLQVYEQYKQLVNGPSWNKFQGVPDSHLPQLEDMLGINVQIYRKSSPQKVVCLRKASDINRPTMNIHSHPLDDQRVHYSLILNKQNFCGKFLCEPCGRMFHLKNNLERHQRLNCNEGEPKHTYKDGSFERSPTIFDQLTTFGIFVEEERRKNESFLCWDMECCLEPLQRYYQRSEMDEGVEMRLNDKNINVEYVNGANMLQFMTRHKPVTGAFESVIPGHEGTHFFHNPNPNDLLKDIFAAMVAMSDRNYEIELEKFADEFSKLEIIREQAEERVANAEEDDDRRREKASLKKIKRLERALDSYCRTLTVLTLNGSRYDLNLCKAHLMPKLTEKVRAARDDEDDGEGNSKSWPRAITRGSAILSLTTDELRFLDIALYCPQTSLDKFIKTFNPGGDMKGSFPYELLTAPELLTEITTFPPRGAFYSTLKGQGITQEEYDEAKKVWDALPEPRSLLSYIRWYNCRDVEPFAVACKNLHKLFYDNFKIDIFRQAQSLPGVCLAFLFKRLNQISPTVSFGLFNEDQADLCQELIKSMTGGLSIIVTRFAEKGKTFIRDNPEVPVEKIVGFDFNALYLWAMSQETCTGYPDYWKLNEEMNRFERASETFEEKMKRKKSHGEVTFLKFMAYKDKVYIHTKEHGKQARLGVRQWMVDGFCQDTTPPRVYEYQGCFYHCHENGCLDKNVNLTNANRSRIALDEEKEKDLLAMGYDVRKTWECTFKAIKQTALAMRQGRTPDFTDPQILEDAKIYNEFLKKHPVRAYHRHKTVRYDAMVNSIIQGHVFGFAKVTIRTPDHLKEMFADFPPIFKKADVSMDDIGEYMKGIAEGLQQMKKPRPALINSYHCEEMWIMTPLISWYHSHGLEIVKVHEICQFTPQRVFEWFAETVTHHREMGDRDLALAILGLIFKLLGNAAYGKTITNLAKHLQVFFADLAATRDLHNDPYHHRTIKITDNCFEVHKRKQEIEFSLPIQIGLSVYAWAKQRLISFVYDVLHAYVPRPLYSVLESDTDSLYLGLARSSLKDCIPEDKKADFEKIEPRWFVMQESQLRTPGLLKVEVEGTAFVGISAKCYLVVKNDGHPKVSAKGVQQKRHMQDLLTYKNFVNILKNEGNGESRAFNMGFRPMNGTVYTYLQCKSGLSPLYTKRICMADTYQTLPLEL